MKFIIKSTPAGYHVNQVARNGEVLNSSEVLNSHASAKKNIKSVYKGLGATKKIKVVDIPSNADYFIENNQFSK